jgi:SAM-dependent methyltransferase
MEAREIDEMRRLEDRHWWFVGKRLLVASLLGDALARPGLRVLDVGCGTGGVLAGLGGGIRPFGVDRSTLALAHCRARGLSAVACSSAGDLPFAAGSFDVVMLLDVLEHFADEQKLLAEIRRLVRPGGRVLVSVPAFQFLWSQHDVVLQHIRRYRAGQLQEVLERARLTIERLTYTNAVALPPAVVVRGILQRFGLMSGEGGTDFREHGALVNQSLVGAYRLEARAVARGLRVPFGLSVAAVARVDA